MSAEFVRLELRGSSSSSSSLSPRPKRYLSRNQFEVGQVTRRPPFLRMWPLGGKQENGLFSIFHFFIFTDGGRLIPRSLEIKFGDKLY